MELLDELKKSLLAEVDRLEGEAREIVDNHMYFIFHGNNSRTNWKDKSELSIRLRRRDSSLTIDWAKVKWFGRKVNGTRKPALASLPKNRKALNFEVKYLLAIAKPWEKKMVLETEMKAIRIRGKLRAIQRILQAIRNGYVDRVIAEERLKPYQILAQE